MTYKLLTYQGTAGPRAGVLIRDTVFDAARLANRPAYTTVLGVLADWDRADACFADAAAHGDPSHGEPLSDVSLLAPILYPGQIFAAGANYQDHIEEMNDQGRFSPQHAKSISGRPWFFLKPPRSAVIGHGAAFALPVYSTRVDWEIELAVVIAKKASKVAASQALSYVAGYTVANDLSARDFAVRDTAAADSPFRFDWLSHKGFDGACPLGPWITPTRDIADPQSLKLELWVDDIQMQSSSTKYMIYSVAELIEELTSRLTLHPGDVILTGTPAGVGMSRNVFLRPHQTVRLRIEAIGELRHSFS